MIAEVLEAYECKRRQDGKGKARAGCTPLGCANSLISQSLLKVA
jgi:hypothetical protein